MFKACSRCGRIHGTNYKCTHNKPKYDNAKYKAKEDRLRHTNAWQRKAAEIKQASQYLCEVCRDKGIYTYNSLETHHITKVREDPTRLLDNNNLICLCRMHHIQADNGRLSKKYLEYLVANRENRTPPRGGGKFSDN